tara:strand:+ start:11988 stop:12257 length:270 start_codon:yes stop_codon:yes gene_type:complete
MNVTTLCGRFVVLSVCQKRHGDDEETSITGTEKTSFPPLLQGRYYADFRDEDSDFIVTFDLMLTLYGVSFALPGIKEWRRTLRGREFCS